MNKSPGSVLYKEAQKLNHMYPLDWDDLNEFEQNYWETLANSVVTYTLLTLSENQK